MFEERSFPGQVGSGKLFDASARIEKSRRSIASGLTFENDEARRRTSPRSFARSSKDPPFPKIEGFPIGEERRHPSLVRPTLLHGLPESVSSDAVVLL